MSNNVKTFIFSNVIPIGTIQTKSLVCLDPNLIAKHNQTRTSPSQTTLTLTEAHGEDAVDPRLVDDVPLVLPL